MSTNKKINFFLDSVFNRKAKAVPVRRKALKPTLFSRGRRTEHFFTEDSKLYITPKEYKMMEKGLILDRSVKKWDNLSSRIARNYARQNTDEKSLLRRNLLERYEMINEKIEEQSKDFFGRFSMVRLWNVSIVGAILFGMLSMTMIYRYLGQGASAKDMAGSLVPKSEISRTVDFSPGQSLVLGEEDVDGSGDESAEYIEQVIQDLEENEKDNLEKEITNMVKGHPIEKMVPYIVEKDKIVAAFLIGIAKKESNWGKRIPVLKGQDCYNYWGYRGKRRRMGSGGHTCFNSRKDAVDSVAKRIEWLVNNRKLNTPEKMIVWKCGSTCKGHSSSGVRKWISDVNMYFQKLND